MRYPGAMTAKGLSSPYQKAIRTDQILASTDPVALDYYGAMHILMPDAASMVYLAGSMDLDSLGLGSFGIWLWVDYREIRGAMYPITMDEGHMDILTRIL